MQNLVFGRLIHDVSYMRYNNPIPWLFYMIISVAKSTERVYIPNGTK